MKGEEGHGGGGSVGERIFFFGEGGGGVEGAILYEGPNFINLYIFSIYYKKFQNFGPCTLLRH